MRTVKKTKMYLLITSERIEIQYLKNSNRFGFIAGQNHFSYVKKSLKNSVAVLQIIQNFHC
jgi:hypothetical protein